jgi:hypothetical protein
LLDLVVAAPPGVEIESIDADGTAMIIQVLDAEEHDRQIQLNEHDEIAIV